MKNETNLYLVKDLYEASYIYASGVALHSLKKTDNFYYFSFYPRKQAELLRDAYWSNSEKTLVKAKNYADAVKSLKERIFSNPK